MAYNNVPIGTSNPGCIVILVDQSWSMSEPYGDGTKAERASLAVNHVLEELVLACRRGDDIRERCHVTVIGYGEKVNCIIDGIISEIPSYLLEVKDTKKKISDGAGGLVEVNIKMPIWLEPLANGNTPMHEAFQRASEFVDEWITDRPDVFPPIVINITDGAATHPDLTADFARKIMNISSSDGNALVFNLHIANSGNKVILPHNNSQFTGEPLAEYLFHISSPLPSPLYIAADKSGLPIEQGARCFGYNIDESQMIQLLQFGSLDVTQIRVLPNPTE